MGSVNRTRVQQIDPIALQHHKSDPTISVVIPNYNHADYIGEAIQSVLAQTNKPYEIIVVDDGSTDHSREILMEFGDQISYIYQENQGLGSARNTGILAATGELVALLDADDLWHPEFLLTMTSLTLQYPEAAAYYSSACGMDADGRELPQVFGGPARDPEKLYHTLLRANFIIPSTVLLRRCVVLDVGLFEQSCRAIQGCEDWDLWLRIAPDHDIIGTSSVLVRYRLHDNTYSAKSGRMQSAVRAVTEKHFGPDDGQWTTWDDEKRRAYGGVYRYHFLTSIQKQHDWKAGSLYLRKALLADPSLATDLDLFYDAARNKLLTGLPSSLLRREFVNNATQIEYLLCKVFSSTTDTALISLRRDTYGTANFGLGIVAYNAGLIALSRRFLLKALYFRIELWHDLRVSGNLVKSLLGYSMLTWTKRVCRQLRA